MRHIWNSENWEAKSLGELRDLIKERIIDSPKLGELTVSDLCCMARDEENPVGIYIFADESGIAYTGKTHGRSFHERMVSHIDHREPKPGSPHMAQLVQSIVKKGHAGTRQEAVNKILNMKVLWLPVSNDSLSYSESKKMIAIVERRLLWEQCLNPRFNSPRVKKNNSFSIAGQRYNLTHDTTLGSIPPEVRVDPS